MALHQRTSAAALLAACLAAAAAAAPVGDGAVNAYGQPLLTPSTFTMRGRQVFYEIPAAPILGVLAMMHGCAHDASDFWPRDASACPECDGALAGSGGHSAQLPETAAARLSNKNQPVPACLQACQRRWRTPSRRSPAAMPPLPWTPLTPPAASAGMADGEDVAAILQHWIKQNNFTVRQKTEAAEAGGGCTAGGRLGCSRGLRCRAPASL